VGERKGNEKGKMHQEKEMGRIEKEKPKAHHVLSVATSSAIHGFSIIQW
jgi:hypothetical protein